MRLHCWIKASIFSKVEDFVQGKKIDGICIPKRNLEIKDIKIPIQKVELVKSWERICSFIEEENILFLKNI